ncbi:hypothetical protein BGX24_007321, partial [Mortierella sp. AD032]
MPTGGGNEPDPVKPTTTEGIPTIPTYATIGKPQPTGVSGESDPTGNSSINGSSGMTAAPGREGGIRGGDITFRPGSPTTYRNNADPTSLANSGSVISGPMTGLVFAFAFLGALVIGLVAGFLIAKYTRLGGRRGRAHKEQKDELTEQLRLLTDSLGQQNDHLAQQNQHQQHNRHDRSYLNEEKLAHTRTNQAEILPLFMRPNHLAAFGASAAPTDRLHSQSVPYHNHYQDWNTVGSPMVSIQPTSAAPTTTPSRTPRVTHLPPTQPSSNVDIDGQRGEWLSSQDLASSSTTASVSDLNEFERRRPQIHEEGQGGD